jgi:ABC-type polysaccharide/polyol phosphate export permease
MGMMTSFAMGQVANLTVALFLGTGIFGLVLFYSFIYARFRDLHWRDKVLWFTFLQVFFFAYGIIVSHMLWGMLIIYRVLTDMNRGDMLPDRNQHQMRRPDANH